MTSQASPSSVPREPSGMVGTCDMRTAASCTTRRFGSRGLTMVPHEGAGNGGGVLPRAERDGRGAGAAVEPADGTLAEQARRIAQVRERQLVELGETARKAQRRILGVVDRREVPGRRLQVGECRPLAVPGDERQFTFDGDGPCLRHGRGDVGVAGHADLRAGGYCFSGGQRGARLDGTRDGVRAWASDSHPLAPLSKATYRPLVPAAVVVL